MFKKKIHAVKQNPSRSDWSLGLQHIRPLHFSASTYVQSGDQVRCALECKSGPKHEDCPALASLIPASVQTILVNTYYVPGTLLVLWVQGQ